MQNHSKNNPLELQGNFSVGSFHVSVVGGLGSDELPQLEAFDKVLKIVRERSHTENIPLVSVAINPEGFLPTSFLETGIKYSQAVCRIARYFSLSDFKAFITQIQQAIATHTNVSSSFDTLAKVIEVFSIPRQVANDIFNIGSYKEIPNLENPLEVLKNNITENSLAKINPIPIGTGFLVGGSHLLTNHHVIESKEIAAQCVAQFNYVENAQGYIQKSIDYEFDPILFVTEPDLDYTLVQLKSGMFTRQAGYEFGWVQLIEDDECVKPGLDWVEFQGTVREKVVSAWAASQEAVEQLTKKGYIVVKEAGAIVIWHLEGKYDQDEIKTIGVQMGYEQFADALKRVSNSNQIQRTMGDSVIIVQHPKGKQKQIVLSNNEIIKNGLFQGVLRYRAESDYGSSGSPVFNTRWKLVALHHAAVPGSPEISSTQNQQTANGAVKPVAQQGIRICRIIEDLRRKSNTNSKLRSFIQDFVITAEQLNYPPLPAVARLNGGVSGLKNGYYDCGNDVSLDISEAITCEAWVAKHNDENGVLFHRSEILQGERTGYWIWWIQGKLRLEILNQEHSHILCDTKKPAPQDGLWHHIAFTWSTSQEPKIYIDGEQQETHKIEWRPVQTLSSINAPVLIGAGEIGVGVGNPHLGAAIAEVRLWKTARTQTQIKQTMYRRLTGDHHEEGLIGHWQFEEGRVSNIVYNIASLEGGSNVPSIDLFTPSPKIQPQFGLELNGTNDSIDCGNFVIDKAITFEAWIKSSGRNEYSFIAGQGGGYLEPGYTLRWIRTKDGDKIRVGLGLQHDPYGNYASFEMPVPADNDWHHIAFTWSIDSPNICIYIDGQSQQDDQTFATLIGSSDSNLSNLYIGRNKATVSEYFQGSIAEVRLWSAARSEEQINAAMNRPLSDDEKKDVQLVGYWPLDEQAGNEAFNLVSKDLVGNQPGLIYGGTWLKPKYAASYSKGDYGVPLGDVKWLKASECPASLPLPCGLKFSGKDDQVNCGHDPSLNVTDAITVEAWIKHRFGNCLIVTRGCYVDDGYSLCWHDGKIRVMLKTANQETIVDTKENAPADQVWHHIAFTWDKISQEIFIYVDGRQQDCVVMKGQAKAIAYAGQTKSAGLFSGSLADLKTDFLIGRKTEEAQYHNVAIAEVRLWKVVRTQDQIKDSMTCRLSNRDPDWQDLLGYWRLDDGGEGNTQARNLKADSNHGDIRGAQWFPAQALRQISV